MGLGTKVNIDLDKYLKVLGQVGFSGETAGVRRILKRNNIGYRGSIYQGPKSGDGKILYVTRSSGNAIKTMTMFSVPGAGLFNAMTSERMKVGFIDLHSVFSSRFFKIFIAGLFGQAEAGGSFDRWDTLLLGGLRLVKGCYDKSARTRCSISKLSAVLAAIKAGKAREAAARRAKALREKAQRAREAARRARAAARRARLRRLKEIRDTIAEANKIVARADKLIKLVTQQDKYPGGIDHKDVRRIYRRHKMLFPRWRPTTLKEAQTYKAKAIAMLKAMLKDYSGYKSIQERQGVIGCRVKEYTTTPGYCPAGESPYNGTDTYASCSDLGISVLVKQDKPGCSEPERPPSNVDKGR